jgi:hypothetical protein
MAFVNMFQWALHCLNDTQKDELKAKYEAHKVKLQKEIDAIDTSIKMLYNPPPPEDPKT